MRKQILTAVGISIGLVIIGYVLYSMLFTSGTVEPDPLKVEKETSPPKEQVEPPAKPVKNIEVMSVEGKVQRKRGESSWVQVKKGDLLEMDETILAEDDGQAVLDFENTAIVTMKPNSDFTVKEISSSVARVRVNEGRLSADVVDKGSKLVVETKGSDAKAESTGGKFSVLADGSGQMAVATETGRVALSANGESVVVKEGMQSVAGPDTAPSQPQAMPQSLFLKVGRPGNRVLRKKETKISGRTTPGAVVSINNVRMQVDQSGKFSGTIPLKEGNNQITVAAEHVTGLEKERVIPSIMVDTRPPQVQSNVEWGNKNINGPGTP